jgi:diguanylate cyclase (GGDEF)-like protein
MELVAEQDDGKRPFSAIVGDLDNDQKHEAAWRKNQLEIVGAITVPLVLANLINALVIWLSFHDTPAAMPLSVWLAFIVTICAAAFVAKGAQRYRHRGLATSRRLLNEYMFVASVAGMLWASVPIMVMNVTDSYGQMIVGVVLAGIMFTGALLMSRLPRAAIAFIVPVGLGLVAEMQFQQNPKYQYASILTLVYVAILILAIRRSHRQFVRQSVNEAAVKEQSQLIGLLLRDFEESTSDWLWQTDAKGVLVDIPLIFEGADHDNGYLTLGRPLVEQFEADESAKVLSTSVMRRQGFRDLAMQLKDAEEDRWLSLTGKPIFNNGVFRGFRGVASDITQSKEIEDRIAFMAHYDGLTGLPNRMNMQERLEKALRKPDTETVQRALVWLDLDNFKWVNDTLGHPAGDELLQHVAGRLNELSGDQDMVARISGDEFAMIVQRPTMDDLELFFDDITERLSEPYDLWGSTANCSASVGVRMFDPCTKDARTMLKHADLALYQAKKLGKSNWCMFTPALDERARAHLQVEADLHSALERSEFELHFQPQVDAHTHEMVGCEALLRWIHPERGLVYPGDFIEHAEDNGLITRIGDWVIRAALSEARRLPNHMKVSVNISPLQIHSSNLMTTIVSAIAANNIDPRRLELEITESVLMSDTNFTLKRLHKLKEIGVGIALDDFGTGYSSLSYLRSFPFDKIKIDKSFVRDIESRSDSRSITQATIALAHSLGMRCTAEGVETRFQADFLRDIGCQELQGYFISRAKPLDELKHVIDLMPSDFASTITGADEVLRPNYTTQFPVAKSAQV